MADAYTYQGGRKVPLSRVTTHFISRAPKAALLCGDFEPIGSLTPNAWIVRTNDATLDADLQRARKLGPAYPAYVVDDGGWNLRVTDRIFVRFRGEDATEEPVLRKFMERHKLQLVEPLTPRDCLFRVDAAADVVDVVCQLTEQEAGLIEMVDHDLNIEPEPTGLALVDPYVPMQWYLFSDVKTSIECDGAWRLAGQGTSDVVIAVVDCGFDLDDPNFEPGKFVGWALVTNGDLQTDAAARSEMNSTHPHGTLCAALAAASANEIGGLGVAPGCSLLPVKWQELGGRYCISHSAFGRIIRFLRDKVDVVSCSWSIGANSYWPPPIVEAMRESAISGGRSGNGIVWVWSAGNRNTPIHYTSPAPIPTHVQTDVTRRIVAKAARRFHHSFAEMPGVLFVGAVSSIGQRCHYSNYGRGLDVVAPSENRHLYGRFPVAGSALMAPRGRSLVAIGGTSAATPLVAGVAALVRSANPHLSAAKIASVIRRTSDTDLSLSGYVRCGRVGDEPGSEWDISPVPPYDHGEFVPTGHPDGDWSAWFGFGKVNARRAVEEALRLRQA